MFASTYDRLAAYLAERYGMAHADATALAQDMLARTVLPRLIHTPLGVEPATKAAPGETALADDTGIDVAAIRRVVSASLPG